MPGIGNVISFPGLVRSWISEKNLLQSLWQTSIIVFFWHPQISIAVPPHQRSLSLQPMETITEKPQLDTRQKPTNGRESAQIHRFPSQMLHVWLREHWERMGGNTIGAGIPGDLLWTVSHGNGCTNKTGTMDTLTWQGDHFMASHPYSENCRELMTSGKRRISLSRDGSLYWFFNAELSVWKPCTCK